MTTREDLIAQRNEAIAKAKRLDAELAKLDATPWEERHDWPKGGAVLLTSVERIKELWELLGDQSFPITPREFKAALNLLNAHEQLIACVRALRRIAAADEAQSRHALSEALPAATKALEELDAL